MVLQQQQQGPILSLRMKTLRFSTLPLEQQQQDCDFTMERLSVMVQQEESYACRDYLSRKRSFPSNQVDSLCREKMCEWSYRVVDHFHACRSLVATSFSFLDRFMDRVRVDRSAFKLAAMTCLHLATKIHHKEISLASLAELSRGEFEVHHMLEMERIILEELEWRMHPPTAQCFVQHLLALLPSCKPTTLRAVLHRANFFCELALFDYSFIDCERSVLAVCAVLNSLEGMDSLECGLEEQEAFLSRARLELQECRQDRLDSLRNRLWYLYSQSAQYQQDGVLQRTLSTDKEEVYTLKDGSGMSELSPVSVSRTA